MPLFTLQPCMLFFQFLFTRFTIGNSLGGRRALRPAHRTGLRWPSIVLLSKAVSKREYRHQKRKRRPFGAINTNTVVGTRRIHAVFARKHRRYLLLHVEQQIANSLGVRKQQSLIVIIAQYYLYTETGCFVATRSTGRMKTDLRGS